MRAPAGGALPTSAVAVEQTHNRGGGLVHPFGQLVRLRERGPPRARRRTALRRRPDLERVSRHRRVALSEYGILFDTLSVCLSKGLGAPVGSLVVTSAERAAEARVMRRRLGGGMRQAGILAAAGSYALDHHLERLAEDHEHARLLAEACGVDPASVETNIVLLTCARRAGFRAGGPSSRAS